MKMTAAQAVARFLRKLGTEHYFLTWSQGE